ncbi:SLATT domain-containing protein [Blastococcus deserti]|uniref:SLATT domain-containing protein n=1 Tax=Blastococcus deserti TaxID=2259033 RepID=A0ABW4XHN4_9ACTN
MSERTEELRAFYGEHRIADQLRFYSSRRTLFDRATGQVMALAAVILGSATAAGALGGTDVGPTWLWPVLATVLPAAAAAVTAYSTLYAFEQQSKIYADAIRAVRAAARPDPATSAAARSAEKDAAEWVQRSEAVFRQEQAQWGQLTSQIRFPEDNGR